MKAALWHGPGLDLTVEEVAPRAIALTELRVRITAAHACMTDVIDSKPRPWPAKAPQIRGHGAAGIVEDVGALVRIAKPGERVLLSATSFCGRCRFCLSGNASQCTQIAARVQDPRAHTASGTAVYCDANIGGFAEQAIVSDIQVIPMATSVSDEELAMLSIPGAAGVGAALITAPVERGSSVAVIGCGATGLSYVQGARIAGAERIFAIDPLAERRALAYALGATDEIDPNKGDVAEQIRVATPDLGGFQGWGVDYVYEASADAKAIATAFAIARSGGHIILASVPMEMSANASLPAAWLAVGGKTIHSSQHGSINILRDFPRFAHLIEAGVLDMKRMITSRYRLAETAKALADIEAYRTVGAIIRP